MIFKRFRINCIVRVLLLSGSIWLLCYLWLSTELYASYLIVGSVVVYQVWNLIRYIDSTHRLLADTFKSIANEDFTRRVSTKDHEPVVGEITFYLNNIVKKFHQSRLETEHQFNYLQSVVEQAGMGLMSLNVKGDVFLINKRAGEILCSRVPVHSINHISKLENLSKSLHDTLLEMEPNTSTSWAGQNEQEPMQLSISMTELMVHGEKYRLFCMQNIQNMLEEKEMQAWKELIRVLSHEIMNSLTPISSLAATANKILGSKRKVGSATIEDLRKAIQTIESRSHGLMQFVGNYRKFAGVPQPQLQHIEISILFERLERLVRPILSEKSIHLQSVIPPGKKYLHIDQDLIEQVLLNLVNNSIEALSGLKEPKIELLAEVDGTEKTIIKVVDNGCGISDEALPRIFVPFFTTRQEGSGIGLSLSRQIMRLHGGPSGLDLKREPLLSSLSFFNSIFGQGLFLDNIFLWPEFSYHLQPVSHTIKCDLGFTWI